jgi:glucuronate isomerase
MIWPGTGSARRTGFEVGVYPTFRPDKALAVHQPEAWNAWCDKLSAASGIEVKSYASLLEALEASGMTSSTVSAAV